MGIIEDLFSGKLDVNGIEGNDADPFFSRALNDFEDCRAYLSAALKGRELESFSRLEDAVSAIDGANSCEYFVRGFQVGAQFMMDALQPPRDGGRDN